jgi:hypothetical protein
LREEFAHIHSRYVGRLPRLSACRIMRA